MVDIKPLSKNFEDEIKQQQTAEELQDAIKPEIVKSSSEFAGQTQNNQMIQKEGRRSKAEKDLKLREQRLSLMLSQIQPHFLYNTLNTITALCRVNPKLAEETTIKFSGYLRENMYSMGENYTNPFSKELDHTNIYLDIEKLRFGDRVKVEYDIKSDDFNMPTLTLQPIVENAVKHGICSKLEGGTIKIST